MLVVSLYETIFFYLNNEFRYRNCLKKQTSLLVITQEAIIYSVFRLKKRENWNLAFYFTLYTIRYYLNTTYIFQLTLYTVAFFFYIIKLTLFNDKNGHNSWYTQYNIIIWHIRRIRRMDKMSRIHKCSIKFTHMLSCCDKQNVHINKKVPTTWISTKRF